MRIRCEQRHEPNPAWTSFAYALALTLGLGATVLMLAATGAPIISASGALLDGAFGSERAIYRTITKATPLILTGLATVVVFRARIWSIGQEGQVYAGAMGAYWAVLTFAHLPTAAVLTLACSAAIAAGGVTAWLVAAARNRFGTSEIFSTVMINYVVVYLMSYLLAGGPWMEVGANIAYQQSPKLPDGAVFPVLSAGLPVHLGFPIALLAAIGVHLLIERSAFGYDLRALGANSLALRFTGGNVKQVATIALILSGALAGLAGAGELLGVQHRLKSEYYLGLGYTGIIVAMVGGLRPFATVVVAILFGGLSAGAVPMRVVSGVPDALIPAMQGMILLFVLCGRTIARYRISWRSAE